MAKVGNIGKWKAGKKVGGTPTRYTWSVGTWGRYTVAQGDYGWDAQFLAKGEVYPTMLVEDVDLDKAIAYAERDAQAKNFVSHNPTPPRMEYVPADGDYVAYYRMRTPKGEYHMIPSLFRGNRWDVQFMPRKGKRFDYLVDSVSPQEALAAIELHHQGRPIPSRFRQFFGALKRLPVDMTHVPGRYQAVENPLEGPLPCPGCSKPLYYDRAQARYCDPKAQLFLTDEEVLKVMASGKMTATRRRKGVRKVLRR